MDIRPVFWSEEKLQHLQAQLTGMWAEDAWSVNCKDRSSHGDQKFIWRQRFLQFNLVSPSLKIEVKYAIWLKFERREWRFESNQKTLRSQLNCLFRWLNHVAPPARSLLEKDLAYWEWSLRSYLVETDQLRQYRKSSLKANQQYHKYPVEDSRLCLFRQLYLIVADAYDDRVETDKDIWDLRKMGMAVDLSKSIYCLNFTRISQPWLRQLAQQVMRYNVAVHAASDCQTKLGAMVKFSHFLAECHPHISARDINRTLIVEFLGYLQQQPISVHWRSSLITGLRVVLETGAHLLNIQDLTREQIILDEDLPKRPVDLSREIPTEVLEQLRNHLTALPTTTLRMVTILLECGLRIGELCTLPLDCLVCDDKHEWYLRFYQHKMRQEYIIPLVSEAVVGAIQAQQQEIRNGFGNTCHYLFPSFQSHQEPYKQVTFRQRLNIWAVEKAILDQSGKVWRFQPHQFRHTVGMRLINDDVPLDVISRLLGHASVKMTERYARKRAAEVRKELERVAHKRKTVDSQGRVVQGDPRANAPEVQMTRKGVRGQTLPVGGCGRLVVLGDCSHANKCLTCPMWLTSTDDLPALKSFYERAIRLKQRATETGNHFVIEQQERIITNVSVRIRSLESLEMDGTLCVDDVLTQLRTDLLEAETGLEEIREAGFVVATKHLERIITELKARITTLEEST